MVAPSKLGVTTPLLRTAAALGLLAQAASCGTEVDTTASAGSAAASGAGGAGGAGSSTFSAYETAAANVPLPCFKRTVTLSLFRFAKARSGLPSPFRSAAATERGLLPTA
jgi:hypothetical protein